MPRKIPKKAVQRFRRFIVSLRRLGEAFLERQVAARIRIAPALGQLFYVRGEPRIITQLEPR